MKLSKLFNVEICKNPISIEFAEENPGKTAYITTTSYNNGIECFVDYPSQYNGGVITVSKDGGNGDAFYQKYPFCGNEKVMVLSPKQELNEKELLFYVYLINQNKYKFAYGRKCSLERLRNLDILDKTLIPDWVYKIKIAEIETKNGQGSANLDTDLWQEFKLKEIFSIKRGSRLTQEDREVGCYPFVTAGFENYGISEYIGNPEQETFRNSITIDMFCNSFYYENEFKCDDNVLVLTNSNLNKYNALFISTVLTKDNYKYSYGRQYRQKDFKNHRVKLPTKNGQPDWQYMEDYIKFLPYGDRI